MGAKCSRRSQPARQPAGVTAIESGYAYYTLGRYTEAIVSVLEDAGAYTTNHLVENIFRVPWVRIRRP